MLKTVSGCYVPRSDVLFEEYQEENGVYTANVNADKIESVMQDFIVMQSAPMFLILELPAKEVDERRLRKDNTSPFHKDVYYIDGLDIDNALRLLFEYGELLINDGLSAFGFGVHDGSAEILLSKYNVVTLFAKKPHEYKTFFDLHGIPRAKHCVTAWETFDESAPGDSIVIEVNGKTVFDLPDELKGRGMYLAEVREDR